MTIYPVCNVLCFRPPHSPNVDVTLERLGGLVGGWRRVGEGDGLGAEVVEVAVLAEEERLRGRRVELLAAHDEVRGEVRSAVLWRVSERKRP